ncbi:hypothetical protein FH063_006531 [Azospirillum argentinense]|uniref:Uncharacterized protein n=1 Tax=Azospirillum argentinense TaxID=2970906 RepID=A0A5B0KQU3_9PROT|nr:hypothetical protein FH063_006531 [Azospirillum argentinense]
MEPNLSSAPALRNHTLRRQPCRRPAMSKRRKAEVEKKKGRNPVGMRP